MDKILGKYESNSLLIELKNIGEMTKKIFKKVKEAQSLVKSLEVLGIGDSNTKKRKMEKQRRNWNDK